MSFKNSFEYLTVSMITMNEEKAVGKVIDDVKKYAPGAQILIIDSSKDRTPDIAKEKGATVIRQFPPRGYGPAMDLALRSGSGEVIVTLDCDDTYPANLIPDLAKLVIDDGYDMVDACRLRKKPLNMPWINFLANYGFAVLASILFGKRIKDLHSGMRAYRKNIINNIFYEVYGPALPVELLLRPLKEGYKIKVVNIDYKERIGESTMRPIESAWWTLKRTLRVRFRL